MEETLTIEKINQCFKEYHETCSVSDDCDIIVLSSTRDWLRHQLNDSLQKELQSTQQTLEQLNLTIVQLKSDLENISNDLKFTEQTLQNPPTVQANLPSHATRGHSVIQHRDDCTWRVSPPHNLVLDTVCNEIKTTAHNKNKELKKQHNDKKQEKEHVEALFAQTAINVALQNIEKLKPDIQVEHTKHSALQEHQTTETKESTDISAKEAYFYNDITM